MHETADPALSPVALVFADMAGTDQLMFSPRFLRKEFFPRLVKLVAAWHEHGIKVIFHSDGNLRAVLDDFKQAGIDGINPLEPLSSMYAGDIHKAYPDRVLMGGIDVSQLLPMGSEAEVARQSARQSMTPRTTAVFGLALRRRFTPPPSSKMCLPCGMRSRNSATMTPIERPQNSVDFGRRS